MSRPIPADPAEAIAYYKGRCVSFPESTGCWLWRDLGWHPGSRSAHYPEGNYRGKKWRLNRRLMLTLSQGPLEPGEVACHTCDNHLCINPAHLFIGTQKDNIRDGIAKGHQQFHPSHYTHCKHGHDLRIHAWVDARGWRQCRECSRLRMKSDHYRQQANERQRRRRAAKQLQVNGLAATGRDER